MSGRHTPGPWTYERDGGDRYIRAVNGESLQCDTPFYPWVSSNEADWHLIAAAPDMLGALWLVRMSAGWQHLSGESKAVIDAALAKATGEQP